MVNVLFICGGNVARSQMAEAFYNDLTGKDDASSAGISESSSKRYLHPAEEVVIVMAEEGIDVSKKKVKQVTEEMVDANELVVVMCDKEKCPDFIKNAQNVQFWDIEDPHGKSIDVFRKVRYKIKAKVKELAGSINH